MREQGIHPESLAELAKKILGDRKLIIVSNREPFEHVREGSRIRVRTTTGGLVNALDPLMRTLQGTWIAWASGSADHEMTLDRDGLLVPPDHPSYRLRRIWLTQDEVEKFYGGHVNQTLWPLFHTQLSRVRFRRSEWDTYQKINRRFADAVRDEQGDEPAFIWFQDYHFATAPGMLRDLPKNTLIAQFWHIPWPPWEIFRMHPHRRALLEGLLGCHLIGMQIDLYCHNFLDCVQREFGYAVNFERQIILLRNHTVRVRALPISIDAGQFDTLARSPNAQRTPVKTKYIGVGVERSDYTKGILERLQALALFFELYPKWRKKFTFVQVSPPTRETISPYRTFQREVQQTIQRLNARFREGTWRPIVHMRTTQSATKLAALYRRADIAIVSSLQDGMNLVAKEFIASQVEGQGVLIVSEFAGAKEEMPQAITINPYDCEGFAFAIYRALTLSKSERMTRMKRLRAHLFSHTIYDWMAEFFNLIDQIQRAGGETGMPLPLLNHLEDAAKEVRRAPHIALFCDYDGVLTPIAPRPEEALLSGETRTLLRKIRDSARISTTIISGRSLANIMEMVSVENLSYAGNHGLEISGPHLQRLHPDAMKMQEQMERLAEVFRAALGGFSGVIVENKHLSLTVHYRLAEPIAIADVLQRCYELLEEHNTEGLLRLTTGKKVLEVRPNIDWDKGRAVQWILRTMYGEQWPQAVLPIYLGDDATDEDAFRVLRARGITVLVGKQESLETSARFALAGTEETHLFLDWLLRTATLSTASSAPK